MTLARPVISIRAYYHAWTLILIRTIQVFFTTGEGYPLRPLTVASRVSLHRV